MTDYATLYLHCDSLLDFELDQLQDTNDFGRLNVYVAERGSQVVIRSQEWTLTLNPAPNDDLAHHVNGLLSYLVHCQSGQEVNGAPELTETIKRTGLVVGCVVEPAFDDEGIVGGLIGVLTFMGKGVSFARDTIFDSLGNPVAGLLV